MVIESFGVDTAGQKVIKGNWFYRPEETYHLATRKFLEKVGWAVICVCVCMCKHNTLNGKGGGQRERERINE